MSQVVKQARLTTQGAIAEGQAVELLALFNADGSPYVGDGAGITAAQAVNAVATKTQIAALANANQVSTSDSTAVSIAALSNASAAPTQAEFNTAVALINDLRSKVNSLTTLANDLKAKYNDATTKQNAINTALKATV